MRWLAGHPRTKLVMVVSAAMAVFLVGIELLMAVLLVHPGWVSRSPFLLDGLRNIYVREDWSVIQGDSDRVSYDPQLLYLLTPGTTRFSNREFATTLSANSEGLRDDEDSLEGPDIIVLGDSYALGWGVEQDESFPRLLEKRTGLKVLNASMASFGTGREVLLLERLDTTRARAVVVQYFLNDFEENHAFVSGGSPPATMPEEAFRGWLARQEHLQRYRPFDYLRAALSRTPFHPELESATRKEVARTCLDILLASEDLEALPILFLQIDPWDQPRDSILAALSTLLSSEDVYSELRDRVTPIDLEDVLSPDDFFLLDPHLRPVGHEKVAARLEQALERAGLL